MTSSHNLGKKVIARLRWVRSTRRTRNPLNWRESCLCYRAMMRNLCGHGNGDGPRLATTESHRCLVGPGCRLPLPTRLSKSSIWCESVLWFQSHTHSQRWVVRRSSMYRCELWALGVGDLQVSSRSTNGQQAEWPPDGEGGGHLPPRGYFLLPHHARLIQIVAPSATRFLWHRSPGERSRSCGTGAAVFYFPSQSTPRHTPKLPAHCVIRHIAWRHDIPRTIVSI